MLFMLLLYKNEGEMKSLNISKNNISFYVIKEEKYKCTENSESLVINESPFIACIVVRKMSERLRILWFHSCRISNKKQMNKQKQTLRYTFYLPLRAQTDS